MCDITSNKMEQSSWNSSFQNMRDLWVYAFGLKNCLRKSVVMKNYVLCFFSSLFKEGSVRSKLKQSQSYQRFQLRSISQALGCSPVSPPSFFQQKSLMYNTDLSRGVWETRYHRLQMPTHLLLKLQPSSATDTTFIVYNQIYDQEWIIIFM